MNYEDACCHGNTASVSLCPSEWSWRVTGPSLRPQEPLPLCLQELSTKRTARAEWPVGLRGPMSSRRVSGGVSVVNLWVPVPESHCVCVCVCVCVFVLRWSTKTLHRAGQLPWDERSASGQRCGECLHWYTTSCSCRCLKSLKMYYIWSLKCKVLKSLI